MSRRSLLCVAFLAAVAAVLLHRSLLLGEALVPADGISLFAPWRPPGAPPRVSNYLLADVFLTNHLARLFQHSQLLQGKLPLWNPLIACGVPFAASMQTAAFFPVHAVFSAFAPFRASGLEAFLKLLMAALFMAAYLRGLGASRAAATLSGAVFALCAPMVVWLGFPHVNCALWLPLLFLLVDKGLEAPRRWALFALAYGCMVLGGHPPTILYMTAALCAYAAFGPAGRKRSGAGRGAVLLAAGLGAGALLAAVQLLPFLEYVREGSTAATSAAAARWASRLSPASLVHFFLPYAGGAPTTGFEELGRALGLRPGENFNERVAYVGVLPLFLAAAAAAALLRRRREVRFHAALVVLALTAAYGVPPWPSLLRSLPGFAAANPQRLTLLACFSLAVLAGLGLDEVRRGEKRPLAALWAVCGLALAASVWACAALRGAFASPGAGAFLLRQLPVLLVGLVLSAWLCRRRPPPIAVPVCLAWAALDLLWCGTGYNASVPRASYYPETPAIRLLAGGSEPGGAPGRVLGLGPVLPPNTGSAFGLQDVRGMDFVTVRRYEELINGRAGDFYFFSGAKDLPPALPLLDVRYVVLPPRKAPPPGMALVYRGEMDVYKSASAGRALPVFGHETVPDPADVLSRVRAPGFDPRKAVLLEAEAEGGGSAGSQEATATVTRYAADEVRVRADLPGPGWLLLLDTWFPGWKAFVAGRPSELFRADYAFRAVPLPPGTSEVVFRYSPASFRAGLAASLVSLAALILISLRGAKNGA